MSDSPAKKPIEVRDLPLGRTETGSVGEEYTIRVKDKQVKVTLWLGKDHAKVAFSVKIGKEIVEGNEGNNFAPEVILVPRKGAYKIPMEILSTGKFVYFRAEEVVEDAPSAEPTEPQFFPRT